MDPALLLDRLWAQGAGLDDRQSLVTARESAGDLVAPAVDDQLALWADWVGAEDGQATGTSVGLAERVADDPSSILLVLAIELRAAVSRRDHASIDEALEAIDRMIGRADHGEHGATARAAADLALAETALYGKDLPAARRCLETVVTSGPVAIRITGLMRMATLQLANVEVPAALKRARQALTLARSTQRMIQANQAQLLLGLIAYMNDDADMMRATIEPLIAADPDSSFTRFLLAGLENDERAIQLLGEGLGSAARRGDALAYALCALVGSRRYVALGRRADALVTMSLVRVQLAAHQPQLVGVLDMELTGWRDNWGDDAFARAERDAMELVR